MIRSKWMATMALLSMSTVALADGTYQFDSISNLNENGSTVTGILVNDTVPTTLALDGGTQAQCFSWLQLMMKRPGKFTLTVSVVTSGAFPTMPGTTKIASCNLTRNP